MPAAIDNATAQFLESAAEDLQRQLSVAGRVDGIWVAAAPHGVWITARIVIGDRTIEVSGYGESLVAAYSDLHLRVAEPTLVTAYHQLVGA